MEIRKHMIFSGEVQGVGFRYTAYMAAGKLGLSGWVANLEDGRVEMEVQGRERDIDLLTEKLRNGQWIEITRNRRRKDSPEKRKALPHRQLRRGKAGNRQGPVPAKEVIIS